MEHISVYVDDLDAAVIGAVAEKQGLSISSLVRTAIRAMVDAAPAEIRSNAAAKLEEAQSLSVDDLSASPWSGATE